MSGCGIAWIVALVQSVRAKTLTTSRVWWFPLVVALTVGLIGSGAPWHARWAYAEPRFASAIAALPDSNGYIGESAAPREVAGYTIWMVERHDDIVLFWVNDLYLFGSGGFGHFPGGPNETELYDLRLLDTPTFTHLEGDWYLFTEGAFFPFDDRASLTAPLLLLHRHQVLGAGHLRGEFGDAAGQGQHHAADRAGEVER